VQLTLLFNSFFFNFSHKKESKINLTGVSNFTIKGVFGSVVAGAFQITFRAKIHVNDVFSFFKNHF
jgi:hypothetical protein